MADRPFSVHLARSQRGIFYNLSRRWVLTSPNFSARWNIVTDRLGHAATPRFAQLVALISYNELKGNDFWNPSHVTRISEKHQDEKMIIKSSDGAPCWPHGCPSLAQFTRWWTCLRGRRRNRHADTADNRNWYRIGLMKRAIAPKTKRRAESSRESWPDCVVVVVFSATYLSLMCIIHSSFDLLRSVVSRLDRRVGKNISFVLRVQYSQTVLFYRMIKSRPNITSLSPGRNETPAKSADEKRGFPWLGHFWRKLFSNDLKKCLENNLASGIIGYTWKIQDSDVHIKRCT